MDLGLGDLIKFVHLVHLYNFVTATIFKLSTDQKLQRPKESSLIRNFRIPNPRSRLSFEFFSIFSFKLGNLCTWKLLDLENPITLIFGPKLEFFILDFRLSIHHHIPLKVFFGLSEYILSVLQHKDANAYDVMPGFSFY